MTTTNKGKKLIILGFISIVILFLIYGRYQNPEVITPSAIDSIQRIAFGFYITMIVAFGGIAFGMLRYHKGKVQDNGKDLSTIIALVTWNSKSRKIFVTVFIGYGIFFSLISGTLVYQPEVNFAIHYGATIPSGFIAPCYLFNRTCRITNYSDKFGITNHSIISCRIECSNCY